MTKRSRAKSGGIGLGHITLGGLALVLLLGIAKKVIVDEGAIKVEGWINKDRRW